MSFMKFTFSLLAGLVLLAGCSKKDDVVAATNNSITGNWRWVSTDGGIANNIHETPASTGKEVLLNINADGTYSYKINGVPASAGTYSFVTRQCIHTGSQKTLLQMSGDNDMMIESLGGTSVIFSDEYYDGVNSRYERY